ncbi:hypothetical protein [uncultured Friedmanniella sp.]|uniref:hypothetical protein n=1 Tax=uncultured Friedmanniella sp. TaxID=335381 RepID=UPI0035CC6ACF
MRLSSPADLSLDQLASTDDDAAPQLPVKVAVLVAPATGPSPLVDFASSTVLELRLAALERPASRYTVELHRRLDLLTVDQDGERVEIPDLVTWTGGEVQPRWALAEDRYTTQPGSVPVEAVVSGPGDRSAAAFEPSLSGLAAGPTLELAAFRSLLAAVGADTRRRVESGETPVSAWPLAELGQEADTSWGPVKLLLRSARAEGLALQLFRCAAAAPITVVTAPGHPARYASGASDVAALEQALLALLGARQISGWSAAGSASLADSIIDLTDARQTSTDRRSPSVTRRVTETDVLERLDAEGRRACAVILTTSDLRGITEVVRTLGHQSVWQLRADKIVSGSLLAAAAYALLIAQVGGAAQRNGRTYADRMSGSMVTEVALKGHPEDR